MLQDTRADAPPAGAPPLAAVAARSRVSAATRGSATRGSPRNYWSRTSRSMECAASTEAGATR